MPDPDGPTTPLDRVARRFSLRMVVVDVLGSLVPGVLFLLAGYFALNWPLQAILPLVDRSWNASPPSMDNSSLVEAMLGTGTGQFLGFLLLLLVAYVVGQLFFRQDPKRPDRASFERIKRDAGGDGPVRPSPPPLEPRPNDGKPTHATERLAILLELLA